MEDKLLEIAEIRRDLNLIDYLGLPRNAYWRNRIKQKGVENITLLEMIGYITTLEINNEN